VIGSRPPGTNAPAAGAALVAARFSKGGDKPRPYAGDPAASVHRWSARAARHQRPGEPNRPQPLNSNICSRRG